MDYIIFNIILNINKFNDKFSDNCEPNLIQTAIRVVWEQTGMNLSKCSKWKLIATFVYNRYLIN